MKKTIYFLRSAPYDYSIPGMNLYQSFNAVAKKQVSPPIQKDKIDEIPLKTLSSLKNVDHIFSSRQQRSIATAEMIGEKVEVLDQLSEVGYVMEDFISEEEFYKDGEPNVQKARINFVHALIENKLQESYDHVISRIESLLHLLYDFPGEDIVLFTHGFYLKIIEAYIMDKEIKKNPIKLLEYFDGRSETFKFCEGFIVIMDHKQTTFSKYIRNK